ncbi:MAG: hypothetical protein O2822_00045 [Chloroflexi bacterium]|nr:hypothetical protein [Chloroflexota bacterium]
MLNAADGAAHEVGIGLWLVGGGVRDLAARRPLHDLDLAFSGESGAFVDAIMARLPEADVARTDRFGTASITYDGARMDLARLRAERYVVPGALPEVRATDRIDLDLARRDFTVNAVALGLAGADADNIVDPFEGLADLAARRLRVLHERSFIDDATRLWRGARTAALFDLEPDATTARLITEGARWIDEISGDRLWSELAATARRGRALQTVALLDAWGTLEAVQHGFRLAPAAREALRRRRAMPPERLAAVLIAPLPPRVRTGVLSRLSVSRAARGIVADTVRLLEARGEEPETLKPLEGIHAEARIAAAWLAPARQRELQRALRRWERTRPHLTASELVGLGVPRGAGLGIALRGLRRARFLATLKTAAEARTLTRRVVAGAASWNTAGSRTQNRTARPNRREEDR